MALLIFTLVKITPYVYYFGAAGVFFRITVSLYKDSYSPNIYELLRIFLFSAISGLLWPGLLISKIAL